jgi:hypothetical protein
MAISRAAGQTPQVNGSGGVTTIAVTLPQAVVVGNSIFAVGGHTFSNLGSFSDNLGNAWVVDKAQFNAASEDHVSIGSCKNITVGGSCTITYASNGAAETMGIMADEYSGFSGGASLDKSAGNTGTGTAVDTGTTAATTVADELLMAGVKDAFNGAPYTWGSSFTKLAETDEAGGRSSSADRIVSAAGTYNATATQSNAAAYAAAIATYKAAGAAGNPGSGRIRELAALGWNLPLGG